MSNSSFQMSNFIPIDGKLVMMGEAEVTFSFSSAYSTQILVALWSDDDDGASFQDSQTTRPTARTTSADFVNFPLSVDLHYRITVTGEAGLRNTVYVVIGNERQSTVEPTLNIRRPYTQVVLRSQPGSLPAARAGSNGVTQKESASAACRRCRHAPWGFPLPFGVLHCGICVSP
jgi:hypothetical protein